MICMERKVRMMKNNALEINNLSAKVGSFTLKDVNFSVEKGTIMGLIGKNGAGKTTLIKTMMNMIHKTEGEILFDGIPLFNNEAKVKGNIGVVFDSPIFSMTLKPQKIKNIMAPLYENFDLKRFDELMRRFELNPKKKLSEYSKGMQMKFSVVMALCHNPDLLIFDEATAGLDPIARADILDLLLELMQKEERSIIFSTHITSDLERIADYITMIDGGKIVFSEEKDKLLDKYDLIQVEKEAMKDDIKSGIIGLKETNFGFEGLFKKALNLGEVPGIKTTRPTIENIMVYSCDRNL